MLKQIAIIFLRIFSVLCLAIVAGNMFFSGAFASAAWFGAQTNVSDQVAGLIFSILGFASLFMIFALFIFKKSKKVFNKIVFAYAGLVFFGSYISDSLQFDKSDLASRMAFIVFPGGWSEIPLYMLLLLTLAVLAACSLLGTKADNKSIPTISA